MYRKKIIMVVLCGIVAISNAACGEENKETAAPVQETKQIETEKTVAEEETLQEEIVEAEDNIVAEETAETDTAATEESTKNEENKTSGLTIGSMELEEICAKYDEVLSTYDIESYFGYNLPDGWTSDDYGVDGRQESRYVDTWTSDNIEHDDLVDVYGTETIKIQGIDRVKTLGTYVTDDNGNEFIPPSDEFEYQNNYNDALHEFYKTKEWKEPERPKCPVGWPDEEYGYEQYCPIRIYQGEIETPYGKGILCSAVYEGVRYTGYDAETHCYTEVSDTYLWSRDEEMILEIDDQFVIISYSYYEWSDLGATIEPDDLNYTGRLDEIIPQMF